MSFSGQEREGQHHAACQFVPVNSSRSYEERRMEISGLGYLDFTV